MPSHFAKCCQNFLFGGLAGGQQSADCPEQQRKGEADRHDFGADLDVEAGLTERDEIPHAGGNRIKR